MNKSMIEDKSLRREEIKLAIRRASPEDMFKLKGASKTAVSFYKPHTRKIVGGARPKQKSQDVKST